VKKSKEARYKASQEREKAEKCKKREDLRDERKRQKMVDEESKKRVRIEERLNRLSIQVDKRLHKEAYFQREKAIFLLAKTLSKDFLRRGKAAELVSSQIVLDMRSTTTASYGSNKQNEQEKCSSSLTTLSPKLSQIFEEDVLRVRDFISTFGSFFIERGYIKSIPSLDALQKAINSLRWENGKVVSRMEAVSLLTNLAVALCKPLAASQTRFLFASLITLNPGLQKDFGAAFFNGVNIANASGAAKSDKSDQKGETSGTGGTGDGSGEGGNTNPDVLLPVDEMTWQEIARIAFLSDALGELEYSRQEAAHLLRGYRSAGHPNSKEARRL